MSSAMYLYRSEDGTWKFDKGPNKGYIDIYSTFQDCKVVPLKMSDCTETCPLVDAKKTPKQTRDKLKLGAPCPKKYQCQIGNGKCRPSDKHIPKCESLPMRVQIKRRNLKSVVRDMRQEVKKQLLLAYFSDSHRAIVETRHATKEGKGAICRYILDECTMFAEEYKTRCKRS